MSAREYWRRRRPLAAELLMLVGEAGDSKEAWRVYEAWLNGRVSFEEARKKLMILANGRRKAKKAR